VDLAAEEPTTASADAGYFSHDNVARDGGRIDLLIAAGRVDLAAAGSKTGINSADCAACPLRARCLKPGEARRVSVTQRSRPTGDMCCELRQPEVRRRYARRKAIVEPVFGQLKDVRGFAALSLRGLALATGEYLLACLAHNLGKLLRVSLFPPAPVSA
jgi:IS5 family transposase